MKRWFFLHLAVIFCIFAFAGCGTNKESNADNITMASGPDGNDEIIKINDIGITAGEFRYYLHEQAIKKLYNGATAVLDNDVSGYDWNKVGESGKTLEEEIIDETIKNITAETLMIENASILLTDDEKRNIDEMIDVYISQAGEELFLLSANTMALNSVDEYKKMAYRTMLLQKTEQEITDNFTKYIKDIDLNDYESSEKVTAQHILIESNSEKYEDPQKTINEVLVLARAGADFTELMHQYDEDPGQTDAGYTFGKGEMVKEFEEAAYSLKCDEISDVVETSYGYHIIKRIAGLAELQNYWMQSATCEINENLIKKVSVSEIMNTTTNAKRILQEKNKAQKNKNTKGE